MKKNDLLIALNSSIENWNVKSGGCDYYRCDYTTNNISCKHFLLILIKVYYNNSSQNYGY